MKVARELIETLIAVFLAAALVPIIVVQILNTPNLTGIYKTVWSVGAIVVVIGALYMVLKSVGVGGDR